MHKKTTLAAALLVGALISAPAMAAGKAFVTVNGVAIPQNLADTFIAEQKAQGAPDSPELKNAVREELIRRELLLQEAKKSPAAKDPAVVAQAELARQAVLIRAFIQEHVRKNAVSEAQLKAEYDVIKAQFSGNEYKARHILVETEDEAKKIIADLKLGAKFEDLAAKSKDPGSAARGGDLDWANPNSYVPEFSKAMMALKKGELTQNPVKSQFGYHVIRLDDTREAQFPPFADVKAQVLERLKQMRWAEYQKKLFDGAKTDYKFQ